MPPSDRRGLGLRAAAALLLLLLLAPLSDAVTSAAASGCRSDDVLWLWSGALTSHSITFKFGLRMGHECRSEGDFVLYAFPQLAKSERPHSVIASCRAVPPTPAPTEEEESDDSEVTNVMVCELTDLPHARRAYNYELTVLRSGDVARRGSFRTPAREGEPFSFRMTFASCADEQSDPAVFTHMAQHQPDALFFLHMGDLHYHNLAVDDVGAFRSAYSSIFTSPSGRAMLEMQLPFAYMWDDHDYGPDNSDKTAPGRNVSVRAYREFVPHYPLVSEEALGPVHQAFTVGRVRILLTDLRSARTPNLAPDMPSKTVLGAKQKRWFKEELVRATQDPGIKLILWCSTMPWIDDERKWGYFKFEQQELVNYIKGQALNKWVPIIIVAGDAHMLAVDDGSNSPGNLTTLHAAALGRPGSVKGGPYSHGAFPGSGQYGVLDITDDGGDDVCVYYRGVNIYKGVLVEYDTCHPERTPPRAPYYPPPIFVRKMQRFYKKNKALVVAAVLVSVVAVAYVVVMVVRVIRRHRTHLKKHM